MRPDVMFLLKSSLELDERSLLKIEILKLMLSETVRAKIGQYQVRKSLQIGVLVSKLFNLVQEFVTTATQIER